MNPARQGFGIGSVYENSLSTVIATPVNEAARDLRGTLETWSSQKSLKNKVDFQNIGGGSSHQRTRLQLPCFTGKYRAIR